MVSLLLLGTVQLQAQGDILPRIQYPVDYANPLIGTDSDYSLSNGNVYPAIAMPWGMNFWTPQTGKMGDGWAYTYDSNRIRGFKQTHQPSPWMNDYGQFSIMPVTGKLRFLEEERQSWFSHKAEVVKPYYYSVYLADHDVTTEITPYRKGCPFPLYIPRNRQRLCGDRCLRQGLLCEDPPEGKQDHRLHHQEQWGSA